MFEFIAQEVAPLVSNPGIDSVEMFFVFIFTVIVAFAVWAVK